MGMVRFILSLGLGFAVLVLIVLGIAMYPEVVYGPRGEARYFKNVLGGSAEIERTVLSSDRCYDHPHSPCGADYMVVLGADGPSVPRGPIWPPWRSHWESQGWKSQTEGSEKNVIDVALACAAFIHSGSDDDRNLAPAEIRRLLQRPDTFIAYATHSLDDIRDPTGSHEPNCRQLRIHAYNPSTREFFELDYID
jgi:hypothetical protein